MFLNVCGANDLDARPLIDRLNNEYKTKVMAIKKFQDYYNGLTLTEDVPSGEQIVTKLRTDWNIHIEKLKSAAKSIQESVQRSALHDTPATAGTHLCCSNSVISSLLYDLQFSKEINKNDACVFDSMPGVVSDRKYIDKDVSDKMKDNYNQNPKLHWQHFTSEYGTTMVYPTVNITNDKGHCYDYDTRLQSFYLSGSSSIPKDVVIVLEASTSMSNNYVTSGIFRLDVAKQISRLIINTLGQNDRIAIVSYSDKTTIPDICTGDMLDHNNDHDYDDIKRFVNTIQGNGQGTDPGSAFRKAFNLFETTKDIVVGEQRYRTIVYITDDTNSPDGTKPLIEVIREENSQRNNDIIITTININTKGVIDNFETREYMQNIANQHDYNITAGPVKSGLSLYFSSSSDLRSRFTPWFAFFLKQGAGNSYSFSLPYLDFFSNRGLVLSVCLPAYSEADSSFLGVACADTRVSDLFTDAHDLYDGGLSYVFVIDNYGRTLKHPLLQLSRTIRTDMQIRDIHTLERDKGVFAIIKNMTSGQSGQTMIEDSTRIKSRGSIENEGIVKIFTDRSTYFYGPVGESDFSVAVVIVSDATSYVLANNDEFNQDTIENSFLFHEHDLHGSGVTSGLTKCYHYKRIAYKDKSAIHFNAAAFNDPFEYLYLEHTQTTIQTYRKYFTQVGFDNPGFKRGIRLSVWATYFLEKYWISSEGLAKNIVWRYYASTQGFIRIFPAVDVGKDYDHQTRPWFIKTISQPGRIVLTPPYIDAWGSGWLCSIFHTIMKNSNLSPGQKPEIDGVMGTDIPVPHLYETMLEIYPICGFTNESLQCMLIDNSGFIVVHKKFFEDEDKIINAHIVSQERELASALLENGYMNKHKCTDFNTRKIQYSYRIQVPTGISEVDLKNGKFKIYPVSDSNIFLVIKYSRADNQDFSCCSQNVFVSARVERCPPSSNVKQCTCLCNDAITTSTICDTNDIDEIPDLENLPPTCPADTPDYSTTKLDNIDINSLMPCFDPKCLEKKTQKACHGVAGCSWCSALKNGTVLYKPCCQHQHVCPLGTIPDGKSCPGGDCQCSKPTIKKDPTTPSTIMPAVSQDSEGTSTKTLVSVTGSLVAVIVVILLILALVVYCCIYKRREPKEEIYLTPMSDSPDDYMTAIGKIGGRHSPDGNTNPSYMHTSGMSLNVAPTCQQSSHSSGSNSYNSMPSRSTHSNTSEYGGSNDIVHSSGFSPGFV